MSFIKKINKFIEFSMDKLICIKDPTDPEYMKYNSFSIYMGLLFVATLSATITTVIQKQYSFLPIIIGLTVVAFFSGHDVRKRRLPMKQLNLILYFVEVLLTILCPVLYMTSGGLHSATTYWFFLVLMLTYIMVEGFHKWIFVFLQLALYLTVILLDGYGLVVVSGELSGRDWYLGVAVALISVSLSVGGYISFQLAEYKRQQQRLIIEIQDVSSKKEKSEELMMLVEEQRDIAEKALRTQSEFLSNMNHEIRTPLNAIIGISEVINRIDDVEQIHDLVSNITSAAKGLNVMLQDILEYSATGENKLEIHNEAYNTDVIFNSFRNMCVPRLEEKGLKFIQKRDRIPKLLMGDITRTQQVIFNIANNAIKYTEKGSITFDVRYDYDKQELNITVSDTGIGIEEEELPYIFDQFRRVEESKNKHTDGTGIGLALSKKIIEMMGGKISCESVFGQGSTFHISIPQAIVPVAASELADELPKKAKAEFPGKRIMYVDNTQANHLIMDSILLETGAFVGHEFNPSEVLDLAQSELKSYDAFIIDYVLPGMDGAELKKHLEGRGVTGYIICVTDDLSEKNVEKLKSKGAEIIVSKPLKRTEVHDLLNDLWYPEF